MIAIPSNARVWIATGHTDMRRGMPGLALQVQEGMKRDPHAGDLYVFRGRAGTLIKILWRSWLEAPACEAGWRSQRRYDGLGLSLYAKRLDRGRFIWPATAGEAVSLTIGQLGYLLEGIDWRNPQYSWRPDAAG